MKQGASRTAMRAVVYRAAHQVLDEEPRILDDPVSVGLVPGSSRSEILANRDLYNSKEMKKWREGFVTRGRVAEEGLKTAVEDGVCQYVIVGAGLDTFAHRQPIWARGLRIFEVDHPATQQWKRELLHSKAMRDPSNLTYVACDFERMSLKKALVSAPAFDSTCPAFFSWTGVVIYLTREAIEAILKDVLSLPRGTQMVFDAPRPASVRNGPSREMRHAAERAAAAGEPMITTLPLDEWKRWLRVLGFSDIVHISPEQNYAHYFAGRRDGLHPSRHYLLGEV